MHVLAFDSETALIRPARLAPRPACWTWARPNLPPKIVHAADGAPIIRSWLSDRLTLLIGHNVAFDLAVACEAYPDLRELVFAALDEDRVTDTMIRQWLLDTAAGMYRGRVDKGRWIEHRYDLASVAKRCTGIVLEKDGWRMSYGALVEVPLSRWPEAARALQVEAREKVAELDRSIAFFAEQKEESVTKALAKEREGLLSMIASDPSRVTTYPLDDASATLAVFESQEKHAAYLADQYRQTRAYFALYLSSAHGMRTDPEGVEILRRETQAAYDELETDLIEYGLVRDDKKRTRDTKAAKRRMIEVCKEERLTLRRTDGHEVPRGHEIDEAPCKCKDADGKPLAWVQDESGKWQGHPDCAEHICLDADACNATEDDLLEAYAELSTLKKVLTNDVEMLKKGVLYPVHTKYGFADTGRTTSSKPNIQNLRRRAGIREAFVPRPGCVFFSCDYPQLELYTFAQTCMAWFGFSKLAEALNGGLDPHLAMAATMLGLEYAEALEAYERYESGRGGSFEEEVVDMRQIAKPANFGFPGGMGAPKFHRTLVKQLGQSNPKLLEKLRAKVGSDGKPFLTVDRMRWLREKWQETWPETKPHFARARELTEDSGKALVKTLYTERWRGGASYCAAANNGFQALGADCAKEAAWQICRAQYVERSSPLFNTRTVAFVHDEFVCEGREEIIHEAAFELARVMREAANKYLPDVPVPAAKLKPVAMRRWSKKAKQILDANGRLVPWAP